jgi:hypothetical protein
MAMAGAGPGQTTAWLDDLLADARSGSGARPLPGPALCCRYRATTRTLVWAGRPAPGLFRDGTGRALPPADRGEAEQRLEPGDLLVLGTAALTAREDGARRLAGLARSLLSASSAEDATQVLADEFGADPRTTTACVLVARIRD